MGRVKRVKRSVANCTTKKLHDLWGGKCAVTQAISDSGCPWAIQTKSLLRGSKVSIPLLWANSVDPLRHIDRTMRDAEAFQLVGRPDPAAVFARPGVVGT